MSQAELNEFRQDTRAWLAENCPAGARGPGQLANGSTKITLEPDVAAWLEACVEKRFTAPTWPTEYGGGGLSSAQARVLSEEMAAIKARTPLTGMGMTMIGPTLLELGTQEQKERHLPDIIAGRKQWCQGYSEPGAGSDLAALRTRADDKGDHFLLNGQKIWTSGASTADWMFALVRTDFSVKHEGISFVLLPMDQDGVTVKPIQLISGNSPFCETFLDNAIAAKDDLIGELNKGWTVGKRLLQFERSGIGGLSTGGSVRRGPAGAALIDIAKRYLGSTESGAINDASVRRNLLEHNMTSAAFSLTARRTVEESKAGTPGATTSIFKYIGAAQQQRSADLKRQFMGMQGLGWEGDAFAEDELDATREWLSTKATTIYGGTNEIQLNIIAKRVLGLPE
ncbi:MAG: acyl-CoA dehydrogenase family protein [Pseudomonadaceae bacterium]|nr:acyl-CoA dehydrogenase family protein [Pseudomonadaceae bacterium]